MSHANPLIDKSPPFLLNTGQLTRAAVELAKMWRMDKYLRRLDAALVVADQHQSLQITGNGDVLEPHDGIIAIGSGSPYALAAARALIDVPEMDALSIGLFQLLAFDVQCPMSTTQTN